MNNVSRPLIVLLVGTVAFFALWITMLKPSSSGSGGSHGGVGQYQSAIDQAKQTVANSNGAGIAHGRTVVTTPISAGANTATSTLTPTSPALRAVPPAVHNVVIATHRQNIVLRALSSHRVVAMLFFNSADADDRAVKQELAAVPARAGKVIKLAVPLSELSRYKVVTNQVPVNQSPTLVVVDKRGQAETIAGFTDRFEIAQRIDDALAVP